MSREELVKHILSKSDNIKIDCCLLDGNLIADLMVMVFTHKALDDGKDIDTKVADSKLIDSLIRLSLVEYLSESDSYTIKKKDEYSELVNRILEEIAV